MSGLVPRADRSEPPAARYHGEPSMTPLEALIEARERTQAAHASLVRLAETTHGQDGQRLSHKVSGVKLVLGYIDDALRMCDATNLKTQEPK